MPRKFRCYVPKGASRKAKKVPPSFPCKENASQCTVEQNDNPILLCTDVGVQTDEMRPCCSDAEIQTEVSVMTKVDVAIQTDEQTSCLTVTTEEQTGNLAVEESSSLADSPEDLSSPDIQADSLQICVGNNDEKFSPLIIKHKGVFTNAKGSYGL